MTDSSWPAERPFPFANVSGLQPLKQAWEYSRRQMTAISAAIEGSGPGIEVTCVAISGSLARMEAHPESDVDVLVVFDDCANRYAQNVANDAYEGIWECLAESPISAVLKRPKSGGVFSTVARMSSLTNLEARGIVDEDVNSYGQRMQLLLDAQPVYRADQFQVLQRRILEWYLEEHIGQLFDEAGPFHWLWQDVQRYWRSIRARACWLFVDEPRKSLEVNLKLRSSRLAIIAAMLCAIERSHNRTNVESPTVVLQRQLSRTPLERLSDAIGPPQTPELLLAYQTVWQYTSSLAANAVKPDAEVLTAIEGFARLLSRVAHENMDWNF